MTEEEEGEGFLPLLCWKVRRCLTHIQGSKKRDLLKGSVIACLSEIIFGEEIDKTFAVRRYSAGNRCVCGTAIPSLFWPHAREENYRGKTPSQQRRRAVGKYSPPLPLLLQASWTAFNIWQRRKWSHTAAGNQEKGKTDVKQFPPPLLVFLFLGMGIDKLNILFWGGIKERTCAVA